jgi:hypothetical protein
MSLTSVAQSRGWKVAGHVQVGESRPVSFALRLTIKPQFPLGPPETSKSWLQFTVQLDREENCPEWGAAPEQPVMPLESSGAAEPEVEWPKLIDSDTLTCVR